MSATAAGDQDDQRDGECDNPGLLHGLRSTLDNALLVHTMRSLSVSDSPPERRLSLPTFLNDGRYLLGGRSSIVTHCHTLLRAGLGLSLNIALPLKKSV